MNLRALGPSAFLIFAIPVACSSGSKKSGANLDVFIDTGTRVVEPGDTFECFYTNVNAKTDLAVNGATASQGPGGHHVSIYYTDQNQPAGHHPCIDAEMLTWHQLAVANGNKEGVLDLPAGYATRVPAGKQLNSFT